MKHAPKRFRVLFVCAAAMVATLSACNTVSGVGKDIQEASDGVKKAMQD